MITQKLGCIEDCADRLAAALVPADTAGLLLHIAQQRLRSAEVVMNALTADAKLLTDGPQNEIGRLYIVATNN